MPQIEDYDKNDENDAGGLSEGFTPAQSSAVGSSNGPKQATPQKQQEDAYVPWSSFVDANKDVSDREAGKLAGQVQGDVNKAQGDLSTAQQGFNTAIGNNYGDTSSAAQPTQPTQPATPKTQRPRYGEQPTQKAPPSVAPTSAGPAVHAAEGGAAPQQQATVQQGYTDANGNFQFSGGTPPPTSGEQQRAKVPAGYAAPGWGAFAGAAHAVAPVTPMSSANPGLSALKGYGRAMDLGANAATNGAQGPKDLETQAGAQGWGQLLGDTTKAQQEANALGSETGVQGILQKNASAPTNSAFDAALINGQGAPQFQALNKEYGGGKLAQNVINAETSSQDAWKQLSGHVSTRQAFDAAGKGAAAAPSTATAADGGTSASNGPTPGSIISATSGANGQFDASKLPPNFDPSQNPGYQQALQQLEQSAPVPDWAKDTQTLLSSQQAQTLWPAWAKQLGMTPDQLTNVVKAMPAWQFQMFVRGIVPAGMDRSGGQGYFEGLLPVNVQAQGAGTDPKYAAFKTAMDIYQAAVLAAAGPVAGGISKAGATAVGNSASNPNNTGDPFGNRG